MKDNRFLIYSLIATAVVVALICLAGPFLREATDRQEDTALAEHETVTTGATDTRDTIGETETDACIYEGDAYPADWYVGVTQDPLYQDYIAFQSANGWVSGYKEARQAARDGDLELLKLYWCDYDPWFEPEESLDLVMCAIGRADATTMPFPEEGWQICLFSIDPKRDWIRIRYESTTDKDVHLTVDAYMGRKFLAKQEFLRNITIDGMEFNVHKSIEWGYEMDAFCTVDGGEIKISFTSGTTDDVLEAWTVCTLREYIAKQ